MIHDGSPIVGATISFSIKSGTGSLIPLSSSTDASGEARTVYHQPDPAAPSIVTIEAETVIDGKPYTAEGKVYVVKIKIKQNGTDITDTTHDEIVGKKISLGGEIEPFEIESMVTDRRWAVQGQRISNYVAMLTSATVTQLTNIHNKTIDFYWVDGGNGKQVKYFAIIDGQIFYGKAVFNVKKPTATMTTKTGTVSVDSNFYYPGPFLHYGNPDTIPGITYSQPCPRMVCLLKGLHSASVSL